MLRVHQYRAGASVPCGVPQKRATRSDFAPLRSPGAKEGPASAGVYSVCPEAGGAQVLPHEPGPAQETLQHIFHLHGHLLTTHCSVSACAWRAPSPQPLSRQAVVWV